jgi:hypothetical protein
MRPPSFMKAPSFFDIEAIIQQFKFRAIEVKS